MDQQPNLNGPENLIELPALLVQQAIDRAQHLGIDLSSYIQTLIRDDLSVPSSTNWWRQPLPAAVSQQYADDFKQFLIVDADAPQPSATSGQQLVDLLDLEIAEPNDG